MSDINRMSAGIEVITGDCVEVLGTIREGSVSLSVWSPPYWVGKGYERGVSFESWEKKLSDAVAAHWRVLKPGGFCAVNINDILCFRDESIPRFRAEKHRLGISRADVLAAMFANPNANRQSIAALLGVSEQTVNRRLAGNNARGAKAEPQTRVLLTAHLLEEPARRSGLYLYDRRIWRKDPCWANCQWHPNSYRAVDEAEYILVFWKPGPTKINRGRLSRDEWSAWGSRGVWEIPSVRDNDAHEAMFPAEIPRRLVRLLSEPGDLVIDPFCGSGTTGAVCRELGRDFIGIEIDPEYAKLSRERIFR